MNFKSPEEISDRLNELIPGGCHTYSKGNDQFPQNAPVAITHGNGCKVYDTEGNEFIDCSMGLTSVSIGHGYEDVARAVSEAAYRGTNFQRPALDELKAAEMFLTTVKSGEMVKFAKNGSAVTTAAVKLSRAYTGKVKIAVAADHPFFSYDDWFISSTPTNFGIPKETSNYIVKFKYNDIDSFQKIIKENKDELACVIMEPVKFEKPKNNFLHEIRDICSKNKIVFILDEMVSGFKWSLEGAQSYFGVEPDLSTWGKGIANGFSACALTGKAEIMELGGIKKVGNRKLFLMSSTNGAETTGLAALKATIIAFEKYSMIDENWRRGVYLKNKLRKIIKQANLEDFLFVEGFPCIFIIKCMNSHQKPDLAFSTLLSQEMLSGGILFQNLFYVTWSHDYKTLDKICASFENACGIYKNAIRLKDPFKFLKTEVIKPVFREKI